MNTPDPIKEQPALSVAEAVPAPQTGEITAAIQELLAGGTIADEDKRHIAEALEFMNAPTQSLPDIARHASSIGEVLGGYYMQGAEPPPEVDALNRHFQMLLCQCHMNNAATGLEQVPLNLPEIRHAVQFALDIAKTFAKGYHDDSLLKQTLALMARIEQL